LLLLLQVIEALTADGAADLLAVALNLATAAHLDTDSSAAAASEIRYLVTIKAAPGACPHAAAVAEALLLLFVQLCSRPHLAGAAAAPVRDCLLFGLIDLCHMPGALQLPTGAVVELVELVLHIPMDGIAARFVRAVAGHLLLLLRPALVSHSLAQVHVKRLLALLQGPTAAGATAAYRCTLLVGGGPSIMVWLARQPGAVAAAAELGLTAADVQHHAAVALLFGGPRDEDA
jgi:hypothetical protein